MAIVQWPDDTELGETVLCVICHQHIALANNINPVPHSTQLPNKSSKHHMSAVASSAPAKNPQHPKAAPASPG